MKAWALYLQPTVSINREAQCANTHRFAIALLRRHIIDVEFVLFSQVTVVHQLEVGSEYLLRQCLASLVVRHSRSRPVKSKLYTA
jgi:hypothetical protein